MSNLYETLSGEFYWTRTKEPELSPFKAKPSDPDKYQWKTMFRPDKDSLTKIMDLQSMGVKNQLRKDDKGYFINFNRPTEIKTGRGMSKLEPPKVTLNGKPFDEFIGNGSRGQLTLEVYEHKTQNGGKGHAARLYAIDLEEHVPYQSQS